MPVIELHLIEGYDIDTKTRLGRALTDAVRGVIPADPDAVTVLTHEISAAGYMRGGQPRTPAPALPDPVTIVRDFLRAMEARDLDRAASYLAEGFEMTFPGNVRMTRLDALIAWSKPRYARVAKTYTGFDTAMTEGDPVVFCRGTLAGEWPDGAPFDGIRFVDRFTLRAGKLWRQEVWNDMGEVRGGEVRGSEVRS
ncbi:nuclear transport factor 2 family protein [Dinoroseobacter sp. S124A]|uniref:nuclear transport factor 2 family protein n=1 Tax=Dinoroseobacter sp. S124A TaxID=3415128 RepID=UPI003C7D7DC3